MTKKLVLTLVAVLSIFTDSNSQIVIGKSAGQLITENAVCGSVVVVKQSYQVKNKKNGKVYGRNGRSDFGHFYSLGVKTEAGLVLTDGALKPWLFDTAYKKVEGDYEPVISLTEVRDVEDGGNNKFTQNPLKLDRNQPEGVWIANNNNIVPNAMELDITEGNKDGWLIWYIAQKDLDTDSDGKIGLKTISKKVEISGNGEELEIETPDSGSNVLGAIYTCPVYIGGGHVAYKLVGVAVKNEKQWKLRMPFIGFSFEKKSTEKATEQVNPKTDLEEKEQEEVELTPIEKGKKNKKSKK